MNVIQLATEAILHPRPFTKQMALLLSLQRNNGTRREAEARENEQAGESMQDYWMHQRSEAEDWRG